MSSLLGGAGGSGGGKAGGAGKRGGESGNGRGVKVVRNTMGALAAEPERATVLRELPAILEPLVKVATEAPATNTTLTLLALAGAVEAVVIAAAAEAVPEIRTFTAADGAEAVADPPMLSVEQNTCICGKGGQIQPTTGWSSSAGSTDEKRSALLHAGHLRSRGNAGGVRRIAAADRYAGRDAANLRDRNAHRAWRVVDAAGS